MGLYQHYPNILLIYTVYGIVLMHSVVWVYGVCMYGSTNTDPMQKCGVVVITGSKHVSR